MQADGQTDRNTLWIYISEALSECNSPLRAKYHS